MDGTLRSGPRAARRESALRVAFFGLRATPALVVLAILCGTSIVGMLLTRTASPDVRCGASLLGNALIIWFAASLVALSNERGATAFALLPVFVGAYHGYLYRLSLRYPFPAVSMVLGLCGALALDSSHAVLFTLIAPLTIGVGLTLGTVALRTDALDDERDKLRAAVAAQALEESSREIQRLSTTLLDVLGKNHDIGNSLAAARVNADWLHLQAKEKTSLDGAEVHAMSVELCGSLDRLQRILAEGRRLGRELGPRAALHEVNVTNVIKTTTERFRGAVGVDLDIASNANALVRGGETNLERVLENLLKNAFEGNGERGATKVDVRAKGDPVGHVTIEVVDDGPGFTDAALRDRISAFGTTKKNGGGLGLYTAERLITASGGQLVRANRESGGAVVRVVLAKGGATVGRQT